MYCTVRVDKGDGATFCYYLHSNFAVLLTGGAEPTAVITQSSETLRGALTRAGKAPTAANAHGCVRPQA
jgi:hypothetical protein